MCHNILVVDSSLLNSRTIATMYEAYGCDVTIATNVAGAVSMVLDNPVDVVVMGASFCRKSGNQLRKALRVIRPTLQLAVLDSETCTVSGTLSGADFPLRATHFYSDLRSYLPGKRN
jgi:DNA-binding response OmpR family regulator